MGRKNGNIIVMGPGKEIGHTGKKILFNDRAWYEYCPPTIDDFDRVARPILAARIRNCGLKQRVDIINQMLIERNSDMRLQYSSTVDEWLSVYRFLYAAHAMMFLYARKKNEPGYDYEIIRRWDSLGQEWVK